MNRLFLIIGGILFIGLVVWNIFLTNKITEGNAAQEKLQFKLEMCQGDVQVLRYDLVTTRDSLRILHEFPERLSD